MPTRRSFLADTLGIAVLGGVMPQAFMRAAIAQTLPSYEATNAPENVLVVIQMGGGNDGLNTIVPYSDEDYHRARATIAIDEKRVLRLDDRIGFNPVMTALTELYKEGRVAVVQGVSYPNPNRSHFEATQIWETASPDLSRSTGWLGRYLDEALRGTSNSRIDASNYFSGIALGDTIPTAMATSHVDVTAVSAVSTFGYNTGRDVESKKSAGMLFDGAQPGQSPYLSLIQETARNAYHGSDLFRAEIASFRHAATYPKDPFSAQLALAAQIIGSNIGTRVIFVSIGSFDTHAGQRARQDRLLGYLSDGLFAFYRDLQAHGLADRVLTMTFSEFGRRVQQNASNGTDHGTAMPLFILGGKVKGAIYGDHPSLTDLDDNGDLKFHTDFRSVYATVLSRWLGRNPDTIIDGDRFPILSFV